MYASVAFGMHIPDEPADVDLPQPVKANAGISAGFAVVTLP